MARKPHRSIPTVIRPLIRYGRYTLPVLLPTGVVMVATHYAQGRPDIAASSASARRVFVRDYCTDCHSGPRPAGGFTLAGLDPNRPNLHAPQWEKALVKVRAGMMPPAGSPRPQPGALQAFAASLESGIDRAASVHPEAGAPALHRLNRTEYANSVRDLLGIEVDVTTLLPPDDATHGFDNVADVLNVSPTLLAGYVRAAGKVSRLALGDPKASAGEEVYHVPSTVSQTGHIEGTPFGTRGGISFTHYFPADGEYTFRSSLYFTTNALLFGSTQTGEQLEVAVNGERVALFPINPRMKVDDVLQTPPVAVKAGPQTISVAFVQKASGPVEDFVQPFDHSLGDLFLGRTQGLTGLPHLRNVAVTGPFRTTGVSETPSRKRIFITYPKSAAEETSSAKRILSALARRAYRKPLTDSDVQTLLKIYRTGRENKGDFEAGIRLGVQYILASPQFVFRFERAPAGVAPGANYRLSDVELASRLSYFLWSSVPDDRLLTLAAKEQLHEPKVLEAEVRRMIADPRSEALATNFAGQWLHLRNLKDIQPDLFAYPNANTNLLQSMRRETELLVWDVIRSDRNINDLLTADYTFVNETLAKHYGIPDISGARFRRVTLADPNRRGLLGQASILTVTSFAGRTSPVVRGKWVLDNLLGAPPPKAPANIPPLKEIEAKATPETVRARLEEHRANPACASCHTQMDPIGFALENFDGVGAWRRLDTGLPLDTRGKLVDGTPVDGPTSLRAALLRRSDVFRSTLTAKLLTYALGRGLTPADQPTIRAITRRAALKNNRASEIILGIVESVPFQQRRAAGVPSDRSRQVTAKTVAPLGRKRNVSL
jgi:hypothetical protein